MKLKEVMGVMYLSLIPPFGIGLIMAIIDLKDFAALLLFSSLYLMIYSIPHFAVMTGAYYLVSNRQLPSIAMIIIASSALYGFAVLYFFTKEQTGVGIAIIGLLVVDVLAFALGARSMLINPSGRI